MIVQQFTRRELKEIVLSLDYAKNYNHGTGGHGGYALTAKLARSSSANIVQSVVTHFDSEKYHHADDIVSKAIETFPLEFGRD